MICSVRSSSNLVTTKPTSAYSSWTVMDTWICAVTERSELSRPSLNWDTYPLNRRSMSRHRRESSKPDLSIPREESNGSRFKMSSHSSTTRQQSPSRSPNRRFEWTSSTPEISLRWSIVSNLESQLTLPVLTTSSIGGLEIRDAVNETLEIVHPITGEPSEVSITEIYESSDNADHSIVVFGDGQVDRSPCGTGTCAKMALLHDAGQLAADEPYVHESVVGTRFEGRIIETKQQDGVTLILPTITGSARITGKHTFVKDPRDSITSLSISSNDE